MSISTHLVTVDELNQMPDDGMRREIIGGELYVAAAPAKEHQGLSGNFHILLHQTVAVTGWGKVYYAPVDVKFSEHDQVQPDLLVIRRDRMGIYQGHTVSGPPDLIIEILSPSNRSYDVVVKVRLYASGGVPEYWIADPIARTFQMFRLVAGQYVPVQPAGGVFHSTVVPNLIIDPASIFADLD